jgi:hypothetical protein
MVLVEHIDFSLSAFLYWMFPPLASQENILKQQMMEDGGGTSTEENLGDVSQWLSVQTRVPKQL